MQFVLYGPQPATMDTISVATIVADVRARFHNSIEVATNKLITHLLYHMILNPSTAALANTSDGLLLGWIRRITKPMPPEVETASPWWWSSLDARCGSRRLLV